MNDLQVERLLAVLERIATALDALESRAFPSQQPSSDMNILSQPLSINISRTKFAATAPPDSLAR